MTAAMSRRVPVPAVAVVRSQAALVAAMVVGGVLVVAVAALAGESVGTWWAVVAGAFACASGLVLGSTGRVLPAAGLGLVAAVAVAVAAGSGSDGGRAAEVVQHAIVRPPATAAQRDGAVEGGPAARGEHDRARARRDGAVAGGPATRTDPVEGGDVEGGAAAVVRGYYAALDAHEYARAWARLDPAVQAAFGGFETWRGGYATTIGHALERLEIVPDGTGAVVRLVLVAADRTPCGTRTEQRFAVQWLLTPREGGLAATELSAVKLSGDDPATACG